MNAYELADLIGMCGDGGYNQDAAKMLRQQQAEIDRLTMLCDCMTTESNRKGNEIEELKAHPVKDLDEQFKKGFKAGKEEGWKAHKFHHPVKDLEDIDINITWNENSMRDFGKDELAFARAILRKAQEK